MLAPLVFQLILQILLQQYKQKSASFETLNKFLSNSANKQITAKGKMGGNSMNGGKESGRNLFFTLQNQYLVSN